MILRYRLFESDSSDVVLDELKDNFSNINDLLGESRIKKSSFGDSFMYEFRWSLDIDLSELNDIDKLLSFSNIMKEISDISATKSRMENLDFKISLVDNIITVLVIPKPNKLSDDFEFIFGENWRNIEISKKEIIRFFSERGIDVLKFDDDWTEDCDYSSGYINVSDTKYLSEFKKLFDEELSIKYETEKITRNIRCDIDGSNWISLNPSSEKTYIEFI